jgi:hypothetical protein
MSIRNRFVRIGFLLGFIAAGAGLAGDCARAQEADQDMGRRPYALLHIARRPPRVLFPFPGDGDDYRSYLKTQEAWIRSSLVLNTALQRLEVARLPAIAERSDPVAWLRQNLEVAHLEDTELLRISLAVGSISSAQEQVTLINAVTDAYMEEVVNAEHKRRMSRFDKLRKLQEKYKDQMKVRRQELHRILEMAGSDESPLAFLGKEDRSRLYSDLKARQVQLRLERIEAESLLARRKKAEGAATDAARQEIGRLEDRLAVVTARLKVLDEEMERTARAERQATDRKLGREQLVDEIAEITSAYRKVAAEIKALTVELEAPPRVRVLENAVMPRAGDGALRQR